MIISKNTSNRFDIKNVEDPGFVLKNGKKITGINGYHGKLANIIGWILENIFHKTVGIKINEKTFYFSCKSVVRWLKRVETSLDQNAKNAINKGKTNLDENSHNAAFVKGVLENIVAFNEQKAKPVYFLDHFEKANQAFNEFDRIPKDKESFIKHLESAYNALYPISSVGDQFFKEPEPATRNKISRLFYLLGRSIYGNKMENSRRYLQASLVLKLNAIGLSNVDVLKIIRAHSSTTLLQDSLSKESSQEYSVLMDHPEKILSSLSEAPLKASLFDNKDKHQIFELACILRWLGHTCQNIDALKTDKQRFEIIYGLARECNQNVIDSALEAQLVKDAAWEMVDLIYNTERFMLDFDRPQTEDPEEIKKHVIRKLDSLDHIKPYLIYENESLRASEKFAQIENIKAIEKSKMAGDDMALLSECYQHSLNALKIADKTPNFEPFLHTMFRSNVVGFALKAKKDFSETELLEFSNQMDKVLEYAKINEHIYNPSFIIVAARLSLAQNNQEKALDLLDQADDTARKSPENADYFLKTSQKLRNEILGSLSL